MFENIQLFLSESWIIAKGAIYLMVIYFFGHIYDYLLTIMDTFLPVTIHNICSELKDVIGVIVALLILVRVFYQIKKIRKELNNKGAGTE